MKTIICVGVVALVLVGCGEPSTRFGAVSQEASKSSRAADSLSGKELAASLGGGEAEPPDQPPSAAGRKIIYTASVQLVVEDFIEADARVRALVGRFGGYLAEYREDRTQGEQLAGHWIVRIPVDRYQPFLDEVVTLGVAESRLSHAQDVTEEYVDLEARLSNKRKLEERVLQLLAERTGEIKDVLAVETELGRIREEIERIEGRLRYLKDQTALTTVTVSAREQRDYKPPQVPTFVARVAQTWSGSLTALRATGQSVAIAAVAAAPWAVVLSVVLVPLEWLRRRRWNRRSGR